MVRDEVIATPGKIKGWKYFERVADKIIQEKYINIGLLIDGNFSKALKLLEVISSKNGGHYAFRTLLRWCIVGPIDEITSCETVSCNRISVQDMASKTIASQYFATETAVKDVGIKQMLQKMYAADFSNHFPSRKGDDITEISVDDWNFITLMEKKCSKEGKHYKLPLPIRDHDEIFPDNRSMNKTRLKLSIKGLAETTNTMKIIQDLWKIWLRKGMLKNHFNKFNEAKLGLSLIMAYII